MLQPNPPSRPSAGAIQGEIMFGMIESIAKAAVAVVTVPVAVVADVVTMGGVLTDKDKPYTAEAVEDFVDNLKDAATPDKR